MNVHIKKYNERKGKLVESHME